MSCFKQINLKNICINIFLALRLSIIFINCTEKITAITFIRNYAKNIIYKIIFSQTKNIY